MNKKYIVLAVVIIGAGILYKRSMEGMKRSDTPSADMITLISNDGQKFQISREAAEPSHTLNTLLGDHSEKNKIQKFTFEEAIAKEVTLKPLHGTVLEKMVSLLEELKAEKDKRKDGFNLDNFVIEMFARSDIQELPDLAIAADFLQVEQLANSLMRLYIFQSLKASPKTTVSDIQKMVNKPVLDRIIQKEYSVVESSAGIKALVTGISYPYGLLDLSSKEITNTYGLSLIQNKDKISALDLSNNQMEDLPLGVFNGLSNLRNLGLSNNQLKSLTVGVFNRLTNFQFIDLSNNQLKDLPVGIFNGLSNLQYLKLSNNQLKDLLVGIFNRLSSLQDLELGSNQLKDLPVGIFNGLTNLQQLELGKNQLENLPVGIFNGLTNLQRLELGSNQLKDLLVGIFNGLSNLKQLELSNNQLKDLPVGIFNELTNLTTLWLSNNQLRNLPVGVFNRLDKLTLLGIREGNNLGMTVDQIRALLDPAIRASARIL